MGLQAIGNYAGSGATGNGNQDYRVVRDTVCFYDESLHPFKEVEVKADTVSKTKYLLHKVKVSDPFTIVINMHKAIDGVGTNDKLFESVLNSVNECNASEVWELWEKYYGKEHNENFYESFMNDANVSQKLKFSDKLRTLFKTRNKM